VNLPKLHFASWLTGMKVSLAARWRRYFMASWVVGMALLMVMPAMASADAGPLAAAGGTAADGVADPYVDTPLEDTTWAESPVMLAPLYLRIPEPQLLNSSMRASIFTFVNHNPGATFTQIRESVNAASGTVQHHLRVLVRGGVLRRVRTGKYTRYYPFNHRVLALPPSQETIVKSLVREGPATKSEIAKRTGMSRQLVHYHVEKMAELGLVEVDRDNGSPVIHLGYPVMERFDSLA
jgi:DNA-binding MarR family transcriptional regulator